MLFPTWLVAQNFRLLHMRPSFVIILQTRYKKIASVGRTDDHLANVSPAQTILDGRTFRMQALFKGVSTRFGLQIVEKCFEKQFGNVRSAFQNRRLGTQWGA